MPVKQINKTQQSTGGAEGWELFKGTVRRDLDRPEGGTIGYHGTSFQFFNLDLELFFKVQCSKALAAQIHLITAMASEVGKDLCSRNSNRNCMNAETKALEDG
jgi:hypothetical protein